MPSPPKSVGLQQLFHATMHLPCTDSSTPAQKNFLQMASISFLAQAGKFSAIIA
jgi:hypothetical protein